MLTIVPVYAAIFALAFVALSLLVIKGRVAERVSLGAGNSKMLERRIRIHGNFAEYVPFALILFAFIEMRGISSWIVQALCAAMLLGRIMHVIGMTEGKNFRFRQAGMLTTFAVLVAASVLLLAHSLGVKL